MRKLTLLSLLFCTTIMADAGDTSPQTICKGMQPAYYQSCLNVAHDKQTAKKQSDAAITKQYDQLLQAVKIHYQNANTKQHKGPARVPAHQVHTNTVSHTATQPMPHRVPGTMPISGHASEPSSQITTHVPSTSTPTPAATPSGGFHISYD